MEKFLHKKPIISWEDYKNLPEDQKNSWLRQDEFEEALNYSPFILGTIKINGEYGYQLVATKPNRFYMIECSANISGHLLFLFKGKEVRFFGEEFDIFQFSDHDFWLDTEKCLQMQTDHSPHESAMAETVLAQAIHLMYEGTPHYNYEPEKLGQHPWDEKIQDAMKVRMFW